jgi:cbb3-type cytochrome oxidase subunit 3
MSFIHYLEKIMGVDIYAIIAFLIFFSLFVGMLVWAWKADKELIQKINNIPLNDENNAL